VAIAPVVVAVLPFGDINAAGATADVCGAMPASESASRAASTAIRETFA
jgi:hypothetical protein